VLTGAVWWYSLTNAHLKKNTVKEDRLIQQVEAAVEVEEKAEVKVEAEVEVEAAVEVEAEVEVEAAVEAFQDLLVGLLKNGETSVVKQVISIGVMCIDQPDVCPNAHPPHLENLVQNG
jgi:hypothetical protein